MSVESPKVYTMSKKHRGHCLVINYNETEDSAVDAKNLAILFAKLGFQV